MKKHSWSDDDRNQFDALIEEALRESGTADRRTIFLAGLDDALTKHRCKPAECWAKQVNADIRNDGADGIIKRERDTRTKRVAVSHDGEVLGRAPREMGRRVRGDEGETVHQQVLFDFMSWDELRQKRTEFARAERALAVDRTLIEKLLTLEQRVPGAATPAEACKGLGITLEEFLAS